MKDLRDEHREYLKKCIGLKFAIGKNSQILTKWQDTFYSDDLYNENINLVQITPNETIIEYDCNREEALQYIQQSSQKLIEDKIYYEVYDHEGRSPHIHIKANGNLTKEQKEFILKKYAVNDKVDLSLAVENKLVAVPYAKHWKNGNLKSLIRKQEGNLIDINKIPKFIETKKQEDGTLRNKVIEIFKKHNYKVDRHNRVICPFHPDTNPSLLLNQTNAYCFAEDKLYQFKDIAKIFAEEWEERLDLSLEKIKPQFKTDHLPYFETFDKIVQLIGPEYLPLKKFLYRQIVSAIIKQDIIQVGDVYTDRRIHGIYSMKSGDGKRNIKYASKQICSSFGLKVEEPSSIHPEQLIGKVIDRKLRKGEDPYSLYKDIVLNVQGNIVYLMNKGYLSCDLLQLEEAKELLTSNEINYKECREKLCIGLDPIGRNEVTKRSVDNLADETVKYNPVCVSQVFLQPYTLPEEVVTEGTIRRFLIPYTNLNELEKDYNKKWESETNLQQSITKFVDYLQGIRNIEKFEFTKEAIDKLKEYHKILVNYGRSYSEKGYNFTNIADWTLQEWLIKFAVNVAGTYYSEKVLPEHIDLAFMDLFEYWITTLDFIENKIFGKLDYGEGYKGAKLTERKCLDYLYIKEAISYESSIISIDEFLKEVMKIYKSDSESTARSHYLKFKERGWINSKQVGQHDSKVWITFLPNKFQGYKGSKGYMTYNLICGGLNDIIFKLKGTKPLQPLEPSIEEIKI